MARWITVRSPFDYHWPDRSALTTFREENLGDNFVKDEVADFAVDKGYATEGKVDEAARSSKGKRVRITQARKETPAVKAADTGPAAGMDHADAVADDRPADRPAVDHDAG